MTDEAAPPPQTTISTEPPMTNTPEARTPTGEIKDASAPPAASETPATGAPETYADFTAPEGTTLDKELVAEVTPIFKELGLSQEAAQKLMDFHTSKFAKTNELLAKSVDDMRADWRNQVMSDKDIGGKIDQVKIELGRAKDRLPTEIRSAFDEAMNITGLGDHPAIVKGLYEMAKMVNEGSHVSGGGPSPNGQSKTGEVSRPTLASALYPNLSQ